MKKTKLFLTALATLTFAAPLAALASEAAAEFGPAELVAATQASLKLFTDANGSHVQHLTGFKTWKSGADAKVKLYVNHDGMAMEYNYSCTQSGAAVNCTVL